MPGHDSYKPCNIPINFVANYLTRYFWQDLFGASLLTAFLTGPGETIRDKSDVVVYCGEPPAKRLQVEAVSRR
jgi:hypothetical protein